MIDVLLADDEAMIRAGLAAILATDPGVRLLAEVADGREAVSAAEAHAPDVALLDIRMPELDGLGAAAEIRRRCPDVGVVMLTTFDEPDYVARALELGACGFLLKSGDPREHLLAVRAVAGGAAYLSPRIARTVISAVHSGVGRRREIARRRLRGLTVREREVLALVVEGLSNRDIAVRLHLSEGTVKAHVSAVLEGLGAANRVQAAIIGHEAGLAD